MECKALNILESLVKDFYHKWPSRKAKKNLQESPIVEYNFYCPWCGGESYHEDGLYLIIDNHDKNCPYRKAMEFIRYENF